MATQHGLHGHLGRPWHHTAKQAGTAESAFALLTVGLFGAGSRFGFGAWWVKLPFVSGRPGLK